MLQNYEYCLKELLKYEGGYTNHPSDPGGPTNFGITLADYRMYVKHDGTAEDVRHMQLEDAKRIYKSKYWDKMQCDTLPSGIDFAVFDFGVNSGVSRSLRYLKAAKAKVGDNPTKLVNEIYNQRLAFLRGLKTFPVFGNGWTTRCTDGGTKALKLANPSSGKMAAVPVVVGGVTAAITAPTDYLPWIIGGTIAASVLAFLLTRWLNKKED